MIIHSEKFQNIGSICNYEVQLCGILNRKWANWPEEISAKFLSFSVCLLAGYVSIFYRYFHGHCSQPIREIIPVPLKRVRPTRSLTHSHPFQVSLPSPGTLSHKIIIHPKNMQFMELLAFFLLS